VVTQDSSGLHHEYDPILRRHYYSNFHMTDENIRRYLEHIATIGPCYLHVYPSSAAVIARYLEKTGAKAPSNILGVLAGSENVYRRDRELIERVLNVRFFSWYGHTEKLVLAGECEHCPDYHVWPTYGYFELLDPWGRPVRTPGQRGEIVGTGFINTIVPFIRYHTGDYATYVGDRCSACGREHPVIRDVTGHRTQEMLVAGDGALISWTSLNMHDDTFDRVRQIQFHQVRPGVATLRIVPEDGFGSSDMEAIRAGLNRKLAGRISFDIETVSEIQLTPMGKRTYVDQQIDLSTLLDDSEPVGSEVLSS
jgi:phenylacetate-CoA ligase